MKVAVRWIFKFIGKLPVPQGWKLTWQLYLIDSLYRLDIAELKDSEPKDREKIRELEHLAHSEISMIYEELDALHTRKLIRQARRLRVPVPDRYDSNRNPTGYWEQGNNLGLWYFTHEGLEKVRKAIRDELKWYYWRREHYVNWITGVIGILGAIAGFIIGGMV
ncbi:MAG: hypothetical protein ACLFV2_09235 [Desulfurivibrionaceae bacterium]